MAAAVAEIRNTVTTATQQSSYQSVISTSSGRSNPSIIYQSPQALQSSRSNSNLAPKRSRCLNNFGICFFGGAGLHAAAHAPRAATLPPRRREAWLRIFGVRCGLPCDPPVGGHSCNGRIIPRFHRAVCDLYGAIRVKAGRRPSPRPDLRNDLPLTV